MNSKQLKLGVVLSYVSMGINMIIQLVYTPIMIRLLGQSEYGLYTLVGSVVSYLSLFSLGFTGAYLRFYSRYRKCDDKIGIARLNGMFISIFCIMGLLAGVCGLIMAEFTPAILGEKLSAVELEKAKILMQILVLNIALTFPGSIFDSIVSSQEQFVFQRTLTLASVLFNPFICLPLLLMGYGSVAIVLVTTVLTILKLITSVSFCVIKLKIPILFGYFDLSLIKEISGFSFFIFLNMIIDQINWSVDKFVLGRVVGTGAVAIYGVATQFNTIFMNLTNTISSVFAPRVNRIVAACENDMNEKLTNLLVKVGRLQFMFALYVFIGFVFCGKEFIQMWAGKEYIEAYYVALLLIFPLLIGLPHSVGVEIRRAKNLHQRAAVIMLITAIVNLLISIPLAIMFGAIGAALGTFIGMFINMVLMDIYYLKIVELNVLKLLGNMKNLVVRLWGPICFGLLGLFFESLGMCFAWASIYTIVYVLVMYKWAMNNDEKKMVYEVLSKVINIVKRRRNN